MVSVHNSQYPLLSLKAPLDDIYYSRSSLFNEPTWKKVVKAANEALENFEKKIWKLLNGFIKFSKSISKIVFLSDSDVGKRVGEVFTYLSLLSILKGIYNGKSLFDSVNDLKESKQIGDKEGVIVSSVEIGTDILGCASSLLTLGETLHKLKVIPWITLFSMVAVPLALTSLFCDVLREIYKLVNLWIELSKMPTFSNDQISSLESIAKLKRYLEEKIGVTEEEKEAIRLEVEKEFSNNFEIEQLNQSKPGRGYNPHANAADPEAKNTEDNIQNQSGLGQAEFKKRIQLIKDRKINIMTRKTDKAMVRIMLHANKHLKNHPEDIKRANDAYKDLKKIGARRIILGSAGTFLKVAETVTYVASFFVPAVAFASLTLSLVKSGFSLGKFAYKENVMTKKGLRYWEFMENQPQLK